MLVQDIMCKPVITVDVDCSLLDAAKLMRKKDIGSLIVVENDKPQGIITESDFVKITIKGVDVKSTKVKDVMSKPLITCGPKMALLDLVTLMQRKRVRHIPVVEKGKLVGIITSLDLAWYGIPVVLGR
jgi:CBS domain-containing protein